jgi:hypothetical protein
MAVWRSKTERVIKAQREKNKELGIRTIGDAEEDEVQLEKGDFFAMLISAYGVILPVAILALLLVVGIPLLIILLL